MKIPQLAHALVAAAFALGPIPILVDVPAAAAWQTPADKPDKPNEPHGDGCIPVGVTKTQLGNVYAEEDCHGVRYRRKRND